MVIHTMSLTHVNLTLTDMDNEDDLIIALEFIKFEENDIDILNQEGLQTFESFRRLKTKHITTMAESLAKRTRTNERLVIGMVRLQALIGLMHWVQDHIRIGKDPDVSTLDDEVINEALSRAENRDNFSKQSESMIKVTDPGKLKDAKGWHDWIKAFTNLLSVIPSVTGIPLSYVIRDKEDEDDKESEFYTDFMDECVAKAPLNGTYFKADNKRVHQLVRSYTQGEPSHQHIADIERKQDGRLDVLTLTKFYGGSGNVTRQVSKADHLLKTLHYSRERSMAFETFTDRLKEMFNIFEEQGERMSERAKIRTLLNKIESSHLQVAVQTIRTKIELDSGVTYEHVVNYLASQAATTVDTSFRKISSVETNTSGNKQYGNRGGSGGRGSRGRGGRFSHGRGGRGNRHYRENTVYVSPEKWNKLSRDERNQIIQKRKAQNDQETRKIAKIVSCTINSLKQNDSPAQPEQNQTRDNSSGGTANAGNSYGGKAAQAKARLAQLNAEKKRIMESLQGNQETRDVSAYTTGERRSVARLASTIPPIHSQGFHSSVELDSHADTITCGKNCTLLRYTNRVCDVSPFTNTYAPKRNVPIVQAATAYQLRDTGEIIILIFNEALWFGDGEDAIDHTLINPNQLRSYGIAVHDNPFDHTRPIRIMDNDTVIPLHCRGTILQFESWAPSHDELNKYRHVIMSSEQEWDPANVVFPNHEPSDTSISSVNANYSRDRDDITNILRIVSSADSTFKVYDVPEKRTFLSGERHSVVSTEVLSHRWGIGKQIAEKTLRVTTQRGVRSAIMPLSRRYRQDLIYRTPRLDGKWYTDTMMAHTPSFSGNTCAQVFANEWFFVETYPMESKSLAGMALKQFIRDYGVPQHLTFDGSREQSGKRTEMMKEIHKHDIKYHITEPYRPNQNRVESVIRELRKKWFRIMAQRNVPKRLWDYGLKWCAEIISRTANSVFSTNGRTPFEKVTGETPDISEYIDMSFYDWVKFTDTDRLQLSSLGRWLGVSHTIGGAMTYFILKQNGHVVSRSTVQRVTNLELETTTQKVQCSEFDANISQLMNDPEFVLVDSNMNAPTDWSRYNLEQDRDYLEEFHHTVAHPTIPESEEPTTESEEPTTNDQMHDTYVNMEVLLPRGGIDEPQLAIVTKRARNDDGKPVGTAHTNPLLDSREYVVTFNDGSTEILRANVIAENLFSQVDEQGHRHQLLQEIVDHRKGQDALSGDDAFTTDKRTGKQYRKKSYRGWSLLIQWRDGSTNWVALKDLVNSNPVDVAEYAVSNNIHQENAFIWWVPHVLKKKDRIIAKLKTTYWNRNTKYGLRIPKTMQEAVEIDLANKNTLWQDAIRDEMEKVIPALDVYDGDPKHLVGYQHIKCHMIFDIKASENFRRKARFVAGGHMTDTPTSLTYSSVVSRDSVRILLLIAALNGLDVHSCDIKNAYLTADCREKITTTAGPEFGPELNGKLMIIRKALYGLKSSGAAFRAHLADHIYAMGFVPTRADPDVWFRPAVKENGFKYYEYILCYVDDILTISNDPGKIMENIKSRFELKNNAYGPPKEYLGATLKKKVVNDEESGTSFECWVVCSNKYVNSAVANVEERLKRGDLPIDRLPKASSPMSSNYHPEIDDSNEVNDQLTNYYQELVGVLRWAVELGRIDIAYEVSVMSSQMANPRVGHLKELLHIFGYLKQIPKKSLAMCPAYHFPDERRFRTCDWIDFYPNASEPIPGDIPEPRGNLVDTSCFVDSSHANCLKTRRSHTGILLFVNKSPIQWYSKKQNTVETSTFGSEFVALRIAVEMIEALRNKLRWFGIPVAGPTNIFCDNEAVCKNSSNPESVLKKKHNAIAYHRVREAVAAETIRVAWEETETNLADLLTKALQRVRREFLIDKFMY